MPSQRFNPDDITLVESAVGDDLLLLITGGVRHIGACSTAYLADDGSVQVLTQGLPHHKEHTISESVAVRAARELQTTVTVVMGIHYDNLTRAEIEEVVQVVGERVKEYLVGKI
ncbi:hypothetical protein F4V43_06320 [Paenibacillus spiritus]|uniref:Prenylated flavin chaperone LpdD-like domain-containing protein n=1 Tax=Paenibacillus spiritus TaxID=2496557 RepID=A0A5J5GGB7_9BACL|nr:MULTISPECIES: hypothetical protein [Paenibacillus]KAA9006554.1 hypothetical protein F4V43_06320 [Paenibacillus spiritus]